MSVNQGQGYEDCQAIARGYAVDAVHEIDYVDCSYLGHKYKYDNQQRQYQVVYHATGQLETVKES